MKKLILAVIALNSLAAMANPVPGLTAEQPVCYGREYSKAHMDSHPLQTVRQMKVKFSKEEWTADGLLMNINAEIKREKTDETGAKQYVFKPYSTGMFCNISGSKLNCFIDCDGGRASVNFAIGNTAGQITFKNEGFVMYGGCGDETDEMIFLQSTRGGDDIFKLFALPKEYCQQ